MLQNEADYPDPTSLKPERYLKNGQLDGHIEMCEVLAITCETPDRKRSQVPSRARKWLASP